MDKLVIGYDDNLGLPNDFATKIGCDIQAYHKLGEMLKEFEKNNLSAIFIPAGTLPYIPKYKIVAQALFGPDKKKMLTSIFVSTKKITLSEITQMILGRVNQYCTISFWAPLVYLMNFLKPKTTLTFENTQGFPDMLHKTAEANLDCAMVWDIIMEQHPSDSEKLHKFFSKQDLPTPVLISKVNSEISALNKIINFSSRDENSFFRGFQMPDEKLINQFMLDMEKASKYFKIREQTPIESL